MYHWTLHQLGLLLKKFQLGMRKGTSMYGCFHLRRDSCLLNDLAGVSSVEVLVSIQACKFFDQKQLLAFIIQQIRTMPIYGQRARYLSSVDNGYPAVYVGRQVSSEILQRSA